MEKPPTGPLENFEHLKARCSANLSQQLEKTLVTSEQWMVECASLLDRLTFLTSNRLRVAMALQHLCMEHHQGVHVLVSQGVIGSAFALLRPQFETYVRGTWFHRCASDEQIQAFLDGSDPPRLDTLINELEKVEEFDCGTLGELKKSSYRNLCDFTHGGMVQVKARNSMDEVFSNYRPEHVINILEASTAFSLQAAIAMAMAAEDNDLANRLLERYQEIHKESHIDTPQ